MQGQAAGEEQHPAALGLQSEEINTNTEGRVMCDMITLSVDNVSTLVEGRRKFVGV